MQKEFGLWNGEMGVLVSAATDTNFTIQLQGNARFRAMLITNYLIRLAHATKLPVSQWYWNSAIESSLLSLS